MPLWNPSSLALNELEIARGNVPHVTQLQKFGRNSAVAALADVWSFGGLYNFLLVASPLRIRAGGNAADTAGGVGARSVFLEGLDTNLDPLTAPLATNGALASLDTLVDFRRLFRVSVPDDGAGTYGGNNVGNIIIETNPGGLAVAQISATFGQTQMAIWTVPNGSHFFLRQLYVHNESARAVDVNLFQRPKADVVVAPFAGTKLVSGFNQVSGSLPPRIYTNPLPFLEKTDVWARANNPTAATALSVEFEGWVVENGF